ncbi:glutamyl aminopeptidase-like isoform X1 [Leptopilina heterotoma]|uniref:glutamyl aminopeptidase-like isoform X1 n=1 Tax=Leptopilina heterotoma TaxID=63436 RepID=UPI001CA9E7D5|nr:glutamyl aminopeptidase-like isoform X1 [Leptopilina heterotoma]
MCTFSKMVDKTVNSDNCRPRVLAYRQRGAGSPLLEFVCGLCVFLSLLCSCLTALVVVMNDKAQATSLLTDQRNKLNNYTAMATENSPEIPYRLAKEVKPIHYDLLMHPDLENGTYTGTVTILINVLDKRGYIALHQKDLNITKTKLTHEKDDVYEIPIKKTYSLEKQEVFMISTEENLSPSNYHLHLEFNGLLRPDKIVGFYSSKYKDAQDKERYIATTKFEPTYARRAFPCFDEPSFKAEFTIKIIHPSTDCYGAISNMNVEKSEVNKPSSGLTTVTFARSVPMSTYLSCFIVSDFVALSEKAKRLDGTTFPISVYTTKANKEKGAFALDIGVKIIEYYINLFKVDYPLPKMDMAAIPDFVSGAMENWGLVTYREARLLVDDKISSSANKEGVVSVIAHEFAHMWFGNLVTMAWWNDLWLNEGFATYMSYKSSDAILPDWGLMDHFLTEQLHVAFQTDSKLSSHPIVQTVSNSDDITAIFDVISYNKGASVLRMLNDFVGSDIFYQGITTYLKRNAYRNAETADLFSILQEAIGNRININSIMDTWTRQMGFPVINVTVKTKTSYTVTQKRFLADPEAQFNVTDSDYGYKWTIPITYITSANSTPTLVWFDKDAKNLVVKLDEPVDWIKFNCDQIGYYRVNYETAEWHKLAEVLRWNHKRFSTSDRTHVLEDAFSLADAAELDYNITMDMTNYLSSELHAVPWDMAATKFLRMHTLLSSTSASPKFQEYIRNLVDPVYHEVLWSVENVDSHVTLNLRTVILTLACEMGHTECLEEGAEIFKKWINDPKDERPHPDIRSSVYYYGMSHIGGEAEWKKMFEKFIKETNSLEKLKLMRGLAGVRSASLLNRFISNAMDENYVRAQDAFTCLRQISANPVGTPLVWDWVRENWEFLVKRYTLNDRYLGQLIPAVTSSFASEVKLNEIKAFYEKYPEAGAGALYRTRGLETVVNNMKWLQKNEAKIEAWLNSR